MVRIHSGLPSFSPVFTRVSYTSAVSKKCPFRALVTILSQTACAQISVQGMFPAGHPDCSIRGANLRRIQQNHGQVQIGLSSNSHWGLHLSVLLGPITMDTLLGGPLSCRAALMSTFPESRVHTA